jgi:hypothetical protein
MFNMQRGGVSHEAALWAVSFSRLRMFFPTKDDWTATARMVPSVDAT